MKTKGKVTSLRDMLASHIGILWLDNINVPVPALVTVGKQQDIVKRSIKGMQMTDVA